MTLTVFPESLGVIDIVRCAEVENDLWQPTRR